MQNSSQQNEPLLTPRSILFWELHCQFSITDSVWIPPLAKSWICAWIDRYIDGNSAVKWEVAVIGPQAFSIIPLTDEGKRSWNDEMGDNPGISDPALSDLIRWSRNPDFWGDTSLLGPKFLTGGKFCTGTNHGNDLLRAIFVELLCAVCRGFCCIVETENVFEFSSICFFPDGGKKHQNKMMPRKGPW